MEKIRKLLTAVLVILAISGSILPMRYSAHEDNSIESIIHNEEVLASELKYYFSEIGYFDHEGRYIISDVSSLSNRASSGDSFAQLLLTSYINSTFRSPVDFGKCILTDYFGVYIHLLQGNLWDAFIGHIQREAWTEAAKIVLNLVGTTASKANLVATAGQIAIAAFNCRGKW